MFPVKDKCIGLWLEDLGRVNEFWSCLKGKKCYDNVWLHVGDKED